MSELRFQDVTVRYGTGRHSLTAVDSVSLTVASGQITGLVGESGSGKSTLAKAAVGLVPIADGQIRVDGETPRLVGHIRPIQMIFQDPTASLNPRMTIGDSIIEPAERTLPRHERAARVSELLELVHLDPTHAHAYPGQLSGGQRQRVAIARSLAAHPRIIIADEITSSLDVSSQGAILNLVRELVAELNLTMLFISHNLAIVRYVSNRVAVMLDGRIVEEGDTVEILSHPSHDYTRQLLSAVPEG